MENLLSKARPIKFHRLKLAKKAELTKTTFALEFEITDELSTKYQFEAGQYVTLQFIASGNVVQKDFSMTSAPHEGKISLGIKINSEESVANSLFKNLKVGDAVEVSEPRGRFTLISKPHEFRTIVGFAGGIGITPILSHFKNILYSEPRTRLFLFYGNRSKKQVAFKNELEELVKQYPDRLEIHYFYSQEKVGNGLFEGRLNAKKVALIINQILMLDDTDEESTIWDAVDEVLICGKGEMIKSIANACYKHGIPKKNIHFELFEEFNEDIYPVEKEFPLIEDIEVDFKLFNKEYKTTLNNNKMRLLQQLLIQKFPVPYSCKSGICGSCECVLEEGEVELLENEYLTEKEEASGKILACMSVVLSKNIKVNFDLI
ncbi:MULTISPECIES: ferredoxin--NADP reductase [unclassified Kaistella]|uniref:ferredoxin--NADP reductase n=1 Tax=unclassified Kaistella TaxID=2762626 RepID=UPI0027365DCA|nr:MULTISPECIES: ferredoxin--NADP reductase [unclassified Kaistella]MDP2454547.1 ferredoxin--NADP reductase [Kaistella sp. SH11-4b]MDP2457285.1 ferredoxin--NADP reductase [Kaistella sp. SH40-3]MDP2460045.1 ferredoxin--NADP reductase [Kaistella sp. SH19-2b]